LWRESLCIGVDVIDAQHKKLFDEVAKLVNEVRISGTADKEKCISAIHFLKEYALSHFDDEEAYLRSINYTELESHKKLHESFVETLLEHRAIMEQSNFATKDVKKFVGMLAAWLLYHVAHEDLYYTVDKSKKAHVQNISIEDIVLSSISNVLKTTVNFGTSSIKIVDSHNETFSESVTLKANFSGSAVGYFIITYPISFVNRLLSDVLSFVTKAIDDMEMSSLFEITNVIGRNICEKISQSQNVSFNIKPAILVSKSTLPSDKKFAVDTGKGIIEVAVAISFQVN